MLSPFVSLQSHLLLCWHGFCDISVTLSKLTLDVHPMSDSMELAESVPIGKQGVKYSSQYSRCITPYFGSMRINRVISELCYKGTNLQRSYLEIDHFIVIFL